MPAFTCPRCERRDEVSFLFQELVFTCPNCQARFYPLRTHDPVPDEPDNRRAVPRDWLTWTWMRPRWRWLAAGVGVIVLVLCAAVITLTSWSPEEEPPLVEKSSKKRYTVDELERLVIGKPKDKVPRLIGRPNRTSTWNAGADERWEYFGLVYDPTTNKRLAAFLQIHDGVVESVDCR